MANTEAPYSICFRTQRGTLITIRGDDHEDVIKNLALASAPAGEDGTTMLEMIGAIDAALSGAPAPQPQAQQPAQAAQQPAQELPAWVTEVKCSTCQAPAKFEQQGVSQKSGKAYKRYSCTANQLHKATFTEA